MTLTGLPHSEIRGSTLVVSSPRLIADFCVLLRLPMPRHPSCARIRLARYLLPPRPQAACGAFANLAAGRLCARLSISYMSCNSL